jgi:hypothetical protein
MSHKMIPFSLLPVLLFTTFPTQAKPIDVSEVPVSVIDGIKSSYPNAKNIVIDRELHFRTPLYRVTFKIGAEQNFALFDLRGKLFGQEKRIDPLQLPTAVSRKLEKAFGEYTLLNSLILKHPDGRIEYEVNLRENGGNWILAMSPGGNILTKNPLEI